MEQSKHATAPPTPESSEMETDGDHSLKTKPNILELIVELKQDIATIAVEMRAKFTQTEIFKSTNQLKRMSATWTPIRTSVGLLSPL